MMLTKNIMQRLGNISCNSKLSIYNISSEENGKETIRFITANNWFNNDRAIMRIYFLSNEAMDIDSLSEYYNYCNHSIFDITNKWEIGNIHKIVALGV